MCPVAEVLKCTLASMHYLTTRRNVTMSRFIEAWTKEGLRLDLHCEFGRTSRLYGEMGLMIMKAVL